MIKFRQKDFTLQEGHYSGSKDIDKIPGALATIGKTTLAGSVIGGIYGKFNKDEDEETTVISSALQGAKWGSLAGIASKIFLNYMHKPMSSVKYQDVDRNIRRQFGIFRMSGITVGDSLDKRTRLEERFSFNDRDVSKYKINFAIHNDQITMYTLGLTNDELEKTNKTLDYYCKKYFAMEYTSKAINPAVNSYSAIITFTNNVVLANFIIELSNVLNTTINLLDNSAIVESRIRENIKFNNPEEKTYSILPGLDKADILKILGGGAVRISSLNPSSLKQLIPATFLGIFCEGIDKLNANELQKAGILRQRGDINNQYLLDSLRNLRYVDGFHYTRGEKESDFNMSISQGLFMITVPKKGNIKLDDLEKYFKRSEFGNVYLYTYPIKNDQEFKMLLGKVMKLGKPNIFIGKK